MSDPCFTAAHRLRAGLLAGEYSASELLECFIEQVERTNPAVNALVTLDLEGARASARRADAALARGTPTGPLHGLPLAIKDVFATRGLRTTLGNRHFADHVPNADDILVERERAAGAVILGKSNTPDCASGGITENEIFGLTRNPWNPDRTTSGSGGGGAAALAAGMVAIADGSDVGGSARSPAAWTNLVGFRPTSGRLPGAPGILADGDVSTAGVLARTVADIALFMEACEGPDARCHVSFPRGAAISVDSLAMMPKGLRAAWVGDFAGVADDPEVQRVFADHRPVLAQAGIRVDATPLPLGDDFRTLYMQFNSYAYVRGLPAPVLDDCLAGAPVKPSIRANVERYVGMSALDVFRMFRAREELRTRMQVFMSEHAVVITPAHSSLAFGAQDYRGEAACDWSASYLAPLLGLPSITVPCGFTRDGMPFGITLNGCAGEDQLLLQVAAAFERETGYGSARADLSWIDTYSVAPRG